MFFFAKSFGAACTFERWPFVRADRQIERLTDRQTELLSVCVIVLLVDQFICLV